MDDFNVLEKTIWLLVSKGQQQEFPSYNAITTFLDEFAKVFGQDTVDDSDYKVYKMDVYSQKKN